MAAAGVILVLYDFNKSYVNAGLPECRRKVCPFTGSQLPWHWHSGIEVSPVLLVTE
jgi:hypothetical protein